ncbi:MAG: ABC transporter permease subunit [Lachnospiraceae bacterium]|nr:ABC transporter permease subunit [Lachnospiraceae bacterium]
MNNQGKEKRRWAYPGTILIVLALVGIYELLTDVTGVLGILIFPGFSRIIPAFISSLPKLFESLVSSSRLLFPAYFLGAFLGISLGLVIGLCPRVHRSLQPIIYALSPMPPSMFTPYLITLLPTFYISSVAVIFMGCFWPFLNATISGVLLIEETYLENADVIHLRGIKKVLFVIIPGALPSIFQGAATALNFSFILLTVAEMFATTSGLGYFVQYNADYMAYDKVLAGLIFMALYIVFLYTGFTFIKKKALFWCLNRNS